MAMNEKMQSLFDRRAALDAKIAEARAVEQRRGIRIRRKLVEIVGTALLDQAAKSADFDLMIKGILKTAVTEDSARRFLFRLGWM
jgi:hypothetical protein